jgi:hypothetical protein
LAIAVTFFATLQPKNKNRKQQQLPSPSLLCYNQKTKKEGEVNVVVIAFFGALQPKNKKRR